MHPETRDYYEILKVSSVASLEEIKKAYRERAKICHPDRHGFAPEKVKQDAENETKKINEAFEVLKDPTKRKEYDQELQRHEKQKQQQKTNKKEKLIQKVRELFEAGSIEESLNAAKKLYELFLNDFECRDIYATISHAWALVLVKKEDFIQAEYYFNLAIGISISEELKWQSKMDLEKLKITKQLLEKETKERKETKRESQTKKQSRNTCREEEDYRDGEPQKAQQKRTASYYANPQITIKTQRFQFNVATVSTMQKSGRRGAKIDCDINLSWSEAEVFSENIGGVLLEMILIPGGKFLMGSPTTETERLSSEDPQHPVTVAQFFMGKYPVTQAQWRVVAGFVKQRIDLHPDPSRFKGANRPVDQVSWQEAIEFCARLSAKTGRNYRLPSEGEWEYACRAKSITPFCFGETLTTDLANYDGKFIYGNGSKGKNRQETTSVGSFPANAFGLFDMHGNVWEWCADHWHPNYNGAPFDGKAWTNSKEDSSFPRILRGGSWGFSPQSCRSAFRLSNVPDYKYFNISFRVALSS